MSTPRLPAKPPVWTPLRRAIDRFVSDPSSIRNAAGVMIVATVLIVLLGSVLVWVFDPTDFPDFGGAVWYTLQTVTTVGYGDKVPTDAMGRLVGATVMVVAVALVAIITASITSTFVEAAQRRHRIGQQADDRDAAREVHARLDEIATRLTAIERSLDELHGDRGSRATGSEASGRSPTPKA